jgi:hypothetical protein
MTERLGDELIDPVTTEWMEFIATDHRIEKLALKRLFDPSDRGRFEFLNGMADRLDELGMDAFDTAIIADQAEAIQRIRYEEDRLRSAYG